ncbi:hypothetical protein BABINDRAFT_36753 [Babjeviella inositovora NRRL Y-12698]|uniref:Elongin-C n=1 Tax=Babjeviella inositovora NRRL Y-12698 TaxID=984486 RepID=A0A1E3QQ63_9ASCO|nr:uncharacterized protein BABINDRAFT_36753 [Babjeviella inositovora NRRL Y-12698]ODQ79843.1 hypothetical protein BABINDRAFT_36753 [Babjeviella inositovora NRRL Y-12698]
MSVAESPYVTLISSDNHRFIIDREAAMVSSTLKNSFSYDFEENATNSIKLHEIHGTLLEKVVEYLYYNLKYQNRVEEVPEFNIPTSMALELLMAADYLDV